VRLEQLNVLPQQQELKGEGQQMAERFALLAFHLPSWIADS
jgi:hypothetical protein